MNNSLVHNNNPDPRMGGKSNVEKYKGILSSIVVPNGAVRVDDLQFKLKRQYNLSDKEINEVVEMCHQGGDDY